MAHRSTRTQPGRASSIGSFTPSKYRSPTRATPSSRSKWHATKKVQPSSHRVLIHALRMDANLRAQKVLDVVLDAGPPARRWIQSDVGELFIPLPECHPIVGKGERHCPHRLVFRGCGLTVIASAIDSPIIWEPQHNGFVESLHGRLRDECLNERLFPSLAAAR